MSRSTESGRVLARATKPPQTASAAELAALAALTGLGPKSAAMLIAANIRTTATLRKLGAVAAYHAVKQVDPRASLNLLWALEGALTDQPWQVVAREERMRLLLALEDHARRLAG